MSVLTECINGTNISKRNSSNFSFAAAGDVSSVPVKDVVIVAFMLSLWLYSILLIVRAWAKIHNLPGE